MRTRCCVIGCRSVQRGGGRFLFSTCIVPTDVHLGLMKANYRAFLRIGTQDMVAVLFSRHSFVRVKPTKYLSRRCLVALLT